MEGRADPGFSHIVLQPRARAALKLWQLTGLMLRRATANPTTATE